MVRTRMLLWVSITFHHLTVMYPQWVTTNSRVGILIKNAQFPQHKANFLQKILLFMPNGTEY